MGLIQRVLEAAGLPTVGLSFVRRYSERVRPPRTVFVHHPLGHPMGRPFERDRQAAILETALRALPGISSPGTIVDVGADAGRKAR